MAAAGGAAGGGRRAGVAAPCPAHGPDACRDHALGKLARRQRPRVQPQRRGHPHLLHGCARAGDRRARGDRRRGRVAFARAGCRTCAARARRDRHRRLGDRAAGPDPVLGTVARAGDRGRERRGGGRPADAGARNAAAECGDGCYRARRLPGGSGGVLGADDRLGAHRLGAVGRAVERRRWRPRWGRAHARCRRRIPGRWSCHLPGCGPWHLPGCRPWHLPGCRRGPLAVRRAIGLCRYERRARQ